MNDPIAEAAAPGRRRITRRGFLKGAGAVALLGGAGAGAYYAARDHLRFGLIGAGSQGNIWSRSIYRMSFFMPRYSTIVAVADPNLHAARKLRNAGGAAAFSDHRELLERDDVEAVIVSTNDHWHAAIAIDAMRAGKAVYVEKPMSNTLHESREIVRIAKETKARIMVGTQQRNEWTFRTAADLVRDGRLGKISEVNIFVGPKQRPPGPFAESPVPEGLNWDRWLGPAPYSPYQAGRHKHWQQFWDYGGGELTNWGIHHLDIALWSLGLDHTMPLSTRMVSKDSEAPEPGGFECPVLFEVEYEYPGGIRVTINTDSQKARNLSGVLFKGEQSDLFVSRTDLTGPAMDELASRPLPPDAKRIFPSRLPGKDQVGYHHMMHFYDHLRGETEPIAPVDSHHHSNCALHMANISLRVGRKLTWDAASFSFKDDPEANALINPPRRAGYQLPS